MVGRIFWVVTRALLGARVSLWSKESPNMSNNNNNNNIGCLSKLYNLILATNWSGF